MAIYYKALTELYEETRKEIKNPAQWQKFLATACRNYRLPFEEQVLIYAQRPDATAVLEIERWNRRFGRWVNRGANGIAVFDGTSNGRARLRYYFDISDTHEGRFPRPVPLWSVRPEYEPDIIETLENSFGELENKEDFGAALLSAAKNAVEDNLPDYLKELRYCVEDSFLEDLDELNIELLYRRVVTNSVASMLLTRCGLAADTFFDEDDFREITNFNTPQTFNAIGVASGDIAKLCLSEISRTALALQRQPKKENRTVAEPEKRTYPVREKETIRPERSLQDEDHIHETRRLQPAEPSAAPGAGNSLWEIRFDEKEVLKGKPQDHLHEPADQREVIQPSGGDRTDRPLADRTDRGGDGEGGGRDGGTESSRSDEMDRADEQPAQRGGGNRPDGTDLQLEEQTTEEITIEEADSGKLPAFLNEKYIMAIVANKDDDLKYNKQQMEMFFSAHTDTKDRADYVKAAYPDRYTEILSDGVRIGYKPQEDGLLMWEGAYLSRTAESVFSWELIAQWTAQLIEKKEYFIHTEQPALKTEQSQQLSLFDFAAFDMPEGSLQEPVQKPVLSHPSLPQQIIDEALCVGANDENSRLKICAYFMKDKPLGDNARFLREHYGTNGAGFYFGERPVAIWYDETGIRIAQGESARGNKATLISWEQAAKRIRELLDLGRYMPQEELDRAADFERQELANRLWYLRQDFEKEAVDAGYLPTVHSIYSTGKGFPDEAKAIKELLESPESLAVILEELSSFVAAYEENHALLRFRFHRPQELFGQLRDLQRIPLSFTAAKETQSEQRFFISQDEIDRILRSGNTDYRLEVYSFYKNHTDPKECEKFLKNYHGEYSGSHNGNDNLTYTYKSLSFSHGSITKPYAKIEWTWNKVEKRIRTLIAEDRFLTDADRAAIPKYEKNRIARSLASFFRNVPQEQPRPFPYGFDYWDAVKLIEVQLDVPAHVEEIYQMMFPVWEATPADDRLYATRKKAFEDFSSYRAGSFTLFAGEKAPGPRKRYEALRREYPEAAIFLYLSEKAGFYVFDEDVFRLRDQFGYSVTVLTEEKDGELKGAAEVDSDSIAAYGEAIRALGGDVVLADMDGNAKLYAHTKVSKEAPLPPLAETAEEIQPQKETEKQSLKLPEEHSTERTKAYDLGYGHMGNGLTVWNRLSEVHGDYETVAHISPERTVTIYDTDMPQEVCDRIQQIADTAELSVSATQDTPVFSAPPKTQKETAAPSIGQEQPQKKEALPAPKKRRQEQAAFAPLHPEIPREQRHDFHITDEHLGYGTRNEKYAANAAAIRCLKQIEAEDRLATVQEQEVLSRYVGWGGLSECFEETNPHYQELKSLLDEDEYAAARESTLTAFYTPPVVIRGIYKALSQMGFSQGNILEPSCATGNFLGLLPADMADCKTYGVELDSVSGRIAGQLYQNANICVNGFEKVQMPDSFFDAAVGNVPFGDFKVRDKRYDKHHFLIHDFFFAKALDKLRPGGILAFVTSKGTMDKENSGVRRYLAQRAELIGAIRLPDNTFQKNAGTEVTSDILFFQKRDHITDLEPEWVHLDTDVNGIRMNRYFVEHPEMILGNMVMQSTRFGMDSACKAEEGADLSMQLEEAIKYLQAEITPYEREELDEEEDHSIPADPSVKNFSYTITDGKIYYRENSRMYPVEVPVTAENRIRGMIALRECTRTLIEYQTQGYPDEEILSEQKKLSTLYDHFTKEYGLINSRANKKVFCEDSSYCLLCSLEVLDEDHNLKRKADMFTKRTIRPHVAVTTVDTASEALAVSISEKACVDMDYMAELSGKSTEELEKDLSGVIYRDIVCAEKPEGIAPDRRDLQQFSLVAADEYLSGNVRKKLRMAKAFLETAPKEQKEQVQKNVAALEAVQPQDLGAGEIGVRIGANWVPMDVYQRFMTELLEPDQYVRNRVKILCSKATGQWNITEKNLDRGNVKANTTYGTRRMNAYHILEQTLNQKDVRIFDYVEDENGNRKPILNKKETAIAQDKQELIKHKFQEWVWRDIDRRERLCSIYNETFNSIRPREYDGRHIRFEGMNPEITLRPHQINAVAHILYGGNTLLAHEVGAGKTFEMVAAAMEMKRLGLCTKSLIVVPNHITEQFAAEWLQLYPAANLLVATKKDFETQNRKKFCSRISTGDYDAVIIGHSQIEKIPMSVERQQAILQQQIDEILNGIEEAKREKAERYTIKQMERTKKSLKDRLERLNDQSRKDDVVTFEELGVDRLFIDESHYFKNLFLMTKMRNVGDIAQTEAQKSSDLFMKCRYLDELTGARGVIFATGTPISNSMVELYTIQRYLQYQLLQEMGLIHFDDWAANFGETVTSIELSPEGSGYRAKTRFAKFYNLPELMALFKQVADIQTADMLNLPVPKANFRTEVIKPSLLQQEMIKGLAKRAEEIRGGNVDPRIDNMLRITNDGRKLALDMRLINPLAPDDPNSKVSVCAGNVYQIWEETKEKRSTQLVFCDLSTPGKRTLTEASADGGEQAELPVFQNVYEDLRNKLLAKGVPPQEIAFIHDANTEVKKKELFAKVRRGQVRILLGSTQRMGAGTNIQDKLAALHDLDCPWRPSDLQQRLGRIVRQGNENKEVTVIRYVTEGTFDAYLYQLVENKQKFIAQIMTSKAPVRAAEDVDETALSYSEVKALATGNPLIIEKCNLDMEVAKLNMLKANHLNQRYALEEMALRKYPETITRLTERIAGYEKDMEIAVANPKPAEGFCGMEIQEQRYTEKEAAGKAILDVCTKMTGSDAVLLGKYRGFSMVLAYDGMSNEYRITMKGTLSHTTVLGADVFGNITRLDNTLAGFADSLDKIKTELEHTKIQLETARKEMEAPFSHEAELAEKTARLNKLNILLNMDQKEKTLIDSAPDEGETAPERKTLAMER